MDRQRAQRVTRGIQRLCHRGLEPFAFRREARALVREAIPFDASCWLAIDPASLLITGGLFDYPPELVPALCRNEFLQDDVNKAVFLARQPVPVGILSRATGGHPERSARYRNILRPAGLEAELRAVYKAAGSVWGGGALYRERGRPDFEPEEAAFVASISGLLGEGFRRSVIAAAITAETDTRDGPGLVMLAEDSSIEAISPAAERWIDELERPLRSDAADVAHHVILHVAGRARALAAGSSSEAGLASARVLTRSGRWLLVHATLLQGGLPGRTAVILEPARPVEIAPLIVEAYGLTQRERQITELILQGVSTSEIAARLSVSPLTVRDHLKAIFSKMAVGSRQEVASRIFFDHHFPAAMTKDATGSRQFVLRLH